MKHENDKLDKDIKHKLTIWTEYIKDLFNDEQRKNLTQEHFTNTAPRIMREEIISSFKNTNKGEPSGNVEIPIELIKLIDEEQLEVIEDLFSTMYTNRHNTYTMANIDIRNNP